MLQDAANAQAVSNLAWGFGRLGYSPLLGDLFRALQQQVIDLAWCMRGQDVSNLWWAYGELLVRNEQLCDSKCLACTCIYRSVKQRSCHQVVKFHTAFLRLSRM